MNRTNLLTIILGFAVILGGIVLTLNSPIVGLYTVAGGALVAFVGLKRESKPNQKT